MSKKMTKEEFIERAKAVHGDKYDYSMVDYVNASTKVDIICSKHGKFEQTPSSHINRKSGCPYCAQELIVNIDKEKKLKYCKEKFQEIKRTYPEWTFEKEPLTTHEWINGFCNKHNSPFTLQISSFFHKSKLGGCPVCLNKSKKNIKASLEQIKKQYPHWIFEKEPDNVREKVHCICTIHHHPFNLTVGSFLKEKHSAGGCPHCLHKRNRKEVSVSFQEIKNNYPKWTFENEPHSCDEKLTGFCTEHNIPFTLKISSFFSKKNIGGCPMCKGNKQLPYYCTFNEIIKEHPDWEFDSLPTRADEKINGFCKKHNQRFPLRIVEFPKVGGCPDCMGRKNVDFFTKSRVLSLLTEYDLQSMTSHQLIELIKAGQLPRKLKELVFSRPGTKKRLDTIQKLKDELSSDLSDEQIDKKIEDDIAEEEKEYEEEQELADETGEDNQVLDVEKTEDVIKSLKIYDNCKFTISNCESEKFIVEEELHRLWNKALDEEAVFIPMFRNEPSSGKFFDKMRDMFFEQYDKVKAMTVGSDCVFPHEPNLMQKLMVYYVKNNRCFGNWSAPGAGKSFSRDWAARVIDARVSVYIVPNNVMDTTVKSIREAYGDVNIVVPQKPSDIPALDKAIHNVVILNYHKFQLQDTCDWINGLLKNKIDFICLDEIHNAKVSDTENISLRNRNMNAFLKMARDANPEMKLLAMSGTPIINNLIEVRELMQLMTGLSYEEEIGSRVSMEHVHNAYKALIINGFRYIPKYGINVNEQPVEIDGTLMKDELIDNCGGEVLDMERILSVRKIEYCISEGLVQKSTLVYTHYTDHGRMASGIRNALEKAGFTVGCYTGDEDMEVRRKALADFISGRIDVLVGSDPIGEGVDGLQKVCNRIIPVSLPWTASGWQQLIGRVYRQGSAFKEVDVIIPEVVLGKWSWDRRRRFIIENKRTLGEAVTNGSFEHVNGYNGQKIQKKLLDMALAALRNGIQDRDIARREITTIAIPAAATPRKMSESELNEVHRVANTSRPENIRKNCYGDSADKFMEYHRARRESIQKNWVSDPLDKVAGIISQYKARIYANVIDLGCGENLLKSKVTDGKTVVGVDVEKVDDSVIQANCSDLHGVIDDESFQIAVHCLSLWGNSFEDYIREDYRILESGMNAVLIIVEPSEKFGEGSHYGTEEHFIEAVETVGFRRSGSAIDIDGKFKLFQFTK